MLTILSSDPGYTNYGWAVLQFNQTEKGLRFKVVENGLCRSTVSNLKSAKVLSTQLQDYREFLTEKVQEHKVNAMCAERFMTRGINGPSVEMVNFMLGVMISSQNLPVKLWPAVVWKNAIRRSGVDLKHWYKFCKTTPHQLDAVLIGVYTGFAAYGYKDFGDFDIEKKIEQIVYATEDTTVEKLYARKLRKGS